eukprot:5878141-Prymnesium_polylepis.1
MGRHAPFPGAIKPTSCSAGYHQPIEGRAECHPCPVGEYQPDEGRATCIPCQPDQNSSAGSATCEMCAEDYYTPGANASTDRSPKCVPCSTVRGISCRSNTSMATLTLNRHFWRHSTATLQTWLCQSNAGWSPCVGGADASDDGIGYCAPGYRGPRCELC